MLPPGLRRSWLQTGGQTPRPLHLLARREFDDVDHLHWIGSGCFKLYNDANEQIGILQFQADVQGRIDADCQAELDRFRAGVAKAPDIAAGDTVIRNLDPSDPADMELMKTAVTGVDMERQDPAPINLPDFDGKLTIVPATGTPPPSWAGWLFFVPVAVALLAIAFLKLTGKW